MQPLDYAHMKEELQVWWNGFEDPESGIQSYRIRLVSATTCEENESTDIVVDWIHLEGNYTEYSFVDISLSVDMIYIIRHNTTKIKMNIETR